MKGESIYMLTSPEGVPRYVGRTSVGLKKRRAIHLAARNTCRYPLGAWLREIGDDVRIVEIEFVEDQNMVPARERYHIHRLAKIAPLLNVMHLRNHTRRDSAISLDWRTYMTDDERAKFEAYSIIQERGLVAAATKRTLRNRAYQRKLYQERQSA